MILHFSISNWNDRLINFSAPYFYCKPDVFWNEICLDSWLYPRWKAFIFHPHKASVQITSNRKEFHTVKYRNWAIHILRFSSFLVMRGRREETQKILFEKKERQFKFLSFEQRQQPDPTRIMSIWRAICIYIETPLRYGRTVKRRCFSYFFYWLMCVNQFRMVSYGWFWSKKFQRKENQTKLKYYLD